MTYIFVLILMDSIVYILNIFLPDQIVDCIKSCLDVSFDPATFIQVCNLRCY